MTEEKEFNVTLALICKVFKIVGYIAVCIGLLLLLFIFKEEYQLFFSGVAFVFGGISVLFYGFVGEAIDDIRNNTSKRLPETNE